jgi:hypothetical protein
MKGCQGGSTQILHCRVETKKNYVKEEVCRFCTIERKKKGYEGGRTQILYFRNEEEMISRKKYAYSVL